jgi:hypothetical protein
VQRYRGAAAMLQHAELLGGTMCQHGVCQRGRSHQTRYGLLPTCMPAYPYNACYCKPRLMAGFAAEQMINDGQQGCSQRGHHIFRKRCPFKLYKGVVLQPMK